METGLATLKLALYLSLAIVGSCAQPRPGTCKLLECPKYKVIESRNEYEIRKCDTRVWMSTGPISSSSMYEAAYTGFVRMFRYIGGDNKSKKKMSTTAPVVIQPGKSAYTVLFHLEKEFQSNPPHADGLTVQTWKHTHVAVRQFSGNLSDTLAKHELATLIASLKGSKWIGSIEKNKGSYFVANYNFPFEIIGTTNEITVPFDM